MCRAFAQLVASELLERFPAECGLQENRLLAQMQRFLSTNRDLLAAKQSVGPCISTFDPDLACQPQGIFCQVCCRLQTSPGQILARFIGQSTGCVLRFAIYRSRCEKPCLGFP